MDDTRNTHAQLLQDNALLRQRLARLEAEFSSAVDPDHELLPPMAPKHDARRVPTDALPRPLAASEARRCALPETAPGGMVTLNEHGIIEACSPAAARLFGYSTEALIGHNVTLLVPALYGVGYAGSLAQYLRSGGPYSLGLEVVGQRQDGTTFPLFLALSEVCRDDQRWFSGLLRDLTVRQPAEHDLLRANRLALVGQFACGLAHEIGTPLNVIAGNAELLRMQYGALGLSTAELETIVVQSHRIARLLEELLGFARSKEGPMASLALRQPLQQVLGLLEPLFARAGITVIMTIPADLPSIQGSSDQLEQVFLNLLVNAWQAMPSGGTITINAYATPTHCVCLTCQDTGHGMSAQGLARAFEPFYSTKGDKGTGLGLTMCQQIIASHGGRMALQSTPGEGTTVTVVLPPAGSVPEPEGDTRPLGARGGGRTSAP